MNDQRNAVSGEWLSGQTRTSRQLSERAEPSHNHAGPRDMVRDWKDAAYWRGVIKNSVSESVAEVAPRHTQIDGVIDLASRRSERESDQRIELLSRKFARTHLSPEERARLAILTEKKRALNPGLTEDDLDAMNAVEQVLAKAEVRMADLAEKYSD